MSGYTKHAQAGLCKIQLNYIIVPVSRFSISNDLKFDAERDLKDIDAPHIPVLALNKVSPGEISHRTGKYIYFPPKIFVTVYTHMSKSKHSYQNFEYSICYSRLSMETQLPQKESYLQLIQH